MDSFIDRIPIAYVSFSQFNFTFSTFGKLAKGNNNRSCCGARLDSFGRKKLRSFSSEDMFLRFVTFPFQPQRLMIYLIPCIAVMLAQIRKKIVQFSTKDVKFRTEQVKSPWFHVYQTVKIASRSELHQIPKVSPSHKCGPGCSSPKMVSAADWWLAFGAEIGFDIARIEVEYYEAALGVAAPNISLEGGCAWHRCSHHGEQASVMFLRCCNCKSASLHHSKCDGVADLLYRRGTAV